MFVSVANERKKRKGREVFSGDFLKGKLRIHKSTWFWIKLERWMRNFFCSIFWVPSLLVDKSTYSIICFSYRVENTVLPIISEESPHSPLIQLLFLRYHWHHHHYNPNIYGGFTVCQALRWCSICLSCFTLTAALWTRHPLFLHEKSSYGAFTCSTN